MTPAQRQWAETMLGTILRYSPSAVGPAVDYKPDRLGVGAVFIIDTERGFTRRFREVHVRWPDHVAPHPVSLYRPVT